MSTIDHSSNITVVLHFGIGSFEQGFPIHVEVFESQRKIVEKDGFHTPPAPDIPELYQSWQRAYHDLKKTRKVPLEESESATGGMRKLEATPAQVTHHSSTGDCQSITRAFKDYLHRHSSGWFESTSFQNLQNWVIAQSAVRRDSSVPIMFDFKTGQEEQNKILRKLPWHLWDLFTQLSQAEVTLLGKFQKPVAPTLLTSPVKILAIFGSGEGGLQLEEDERELKKLEQFGAEIKLVREPEREELHNLLSQERWDILFFAGHSFSDEELRDGELLIGQGRKYSLTQLEQDLKTVRDKGLTMAIFNSCDGLGIANFLTNLNVPTVVVFREPVPDLVARKFLRNFLHEFSQGTPLYRAARKARNGLHWLESDDKEPCPCATWLPIICQNPAQPEASWPKKKSISQISRWKRYGFFAMGVAAILGIGFPVWQRGQAWGSSLKPVYSSLGETSLIDGQTLVANETAREECRNIGEKQAGTEAFASGHFDEAQKHFANFLGSCRFDPEAQIYYNNAKALQETGTSLTSNSLLEGLMLMRGSKTLRIAAIVPIGSQNGAASGNKADIALEILRGIARNQQLTNQKGGVNGKPLLVQIVDDDEPGNQDLSERIPTIGSNLVNDPAILAAIGPYSSKATELLGEKLQGTDLISIAPTSTAVRQTSNRPEALNLGRNILRTSLTDAVAAQRLLDDILRAGKNEVTIVYDESDPYSKSLKREFEAANNRKKEKGDKFLSIRICNLADSWLSPDRCLNEGKSDALLWIPPPEVPDRAMNFVLKNKNKNSLPIWAGDSAYGGDVLQDLGQSAEGMKVFVSWFGETAFVQDESTSVPVFSPDLGINWRTAMSYDATGAITQALMRMGTVPQRKEMMNILLSPNFKADGILGAATVQFALQDETVDGKGTGDRLPTEKLGVLVKVSCDSIPTETTCHYEAD